MSDVFQAGNNRIVVNTSTGQVQAWKPEGEDVSVSVSFKGNIAHKGNTGSWISFSHYLTAAEARDLAVVLMQAADHVEALTVVELEDA